MRYPSALVVFVTAIFVPSLRAEEPSFDSSGVKVAYIQQGKGEPVVLLHGFGLSASEMWAKSPFAKTQLLPELAKEYLVIAPDLRGHGKSDKPHDSKKYGGEMADDVIRLLDHLKIKKAHVVGYSMGAWVAGDLLARHPDRLISVTFGGSGPLFNPKKEFTEQFEQVAGSLAENKGIGPLIMAGTPKGEPKPTTEQVELVNKMFLAGKDQKALSAVLRGMKGMEVAENHLKSSTVPVQFVFGSLEGESNIELMSGTRRVLPKAKLTVIEKTDHFSAVNTAEFRAAVLEFLKAHRQ